jgi:hypothetical protein
MHLHSMEGSGVLYLCVFVSVYVIGVFRMLWNTGGVYNDKGVALISWIIMTETVHCNMSSSSISQPLSETEPNIFTF